MSAFGLPSQGKTSVQAKVMVQSSFIRLIVAGKLYQLKDAMPCKVQRKVCKFLMNLCLDSIKGTHYLR